MPINLGSTEIAGLYVGSADVARVYLGQTTVFDSLYNPMTDVIAPSSWLAESYPGTSVTVTPTTLNGVAGGDVADCSRFEFLQFAKLYPPEGWTAGDTVSLDLLFEPASGTSNSFIFRVTTTGYAGYNSDSTWDGWIFDLDSETVSDFGGTLGAVTTPSITVTTVSGDLQRVSIDLTIASGGEGSHIVFGIGPELTDEEFSFAVENLSVNFTTSGGGGGASSIFDPQFIFADLSLYDRSDTGGRNVVNVSSDGGLSSALSSASAGDDIVLASGTYSSTHLLTASGTSSNPIRIIGATGFGSVLTSELEVRGAHVVLLNVAFSGQQLYWTGDFGSIIGCRFRSNTGNTGNPGILLQADDCHIAFNDFSLPDAVGLRMDFESSTKSYRTRVEYNYFHDFPRPGGGGQDNGCEGIQVGTWGGDSPDTPSEAVINSNLFEEVSRDDEAISVKSMGGTIIGNHLLNCRARIELRSTKECTVLHNYVEGPSLSSTTRGIVVQGDDHVLTGNVCGVNTVFRAEGGNETIDTMDMGTPDVPVCRRLIAEANTGNWEIGDTWQTVVYQADVDFRGPVGGTVTTFNSPTIDYLAASDPAPVSQARQLSTTTTGPTALDGWLNV